MSKRTLHISTDLSFPRDAVTQTIVVYGGKGQGKTNLGAVFAEEIADNNLRFSAIDPVGVWHGLRHSADGKGKGVDVLILGGVYGDLPIEPTGGAVVADLVVDEEINVIIDISRRADGRMWSNGEKLRFVADYATRLFERQGERRRPLMQIIDEAGRFVPQQIPHGAVDMAKCKGALEQLVELGRNVGVGVMLITQRSARMDKSVSELAELMIAFRTVGPRSVDAVLDWFGAHIPKDRWNELVEKLRSLPRGTALIVSPGWLEIEGVVAIRARRTLDTSGTPKPGDRRRAPSKSKRPDLAKYEKRIAETIERAKQEDPRALRQEVARLRAELAKAQATPAKDSTPAASPRTARADPELRAVNRKLAAAIVAMKKGLAEAMKMIEELSKSGVIDPEQVRKAVTAATDQIVRAATSRFEQLKRQAAPLVGRLQKLLSIAADDAAMAAADVQATPPPPGRPGRDAGHRGQDDDDTDDAQDAGGVSRMERAFLTVLAQHPKGLKKPQVLTHADYRAGGKVSKAWAALNRKSWTTSENGRVSITKAGLEAVGPVKPLPVGEERRTSMVDPERSKLSSMERAFMKTLFDAYPASLPRSDILDKTRYRAGGKVSKALAKLRRINWAVDGRHGLRASDEFYEEFERQREPES